MSAPRAPTTPMRVVGPIADQTEARMLEQAVFLLELKTRLRPLSPRR